MSIKLNKIYAPLPSTARAITVNLSYDSKSNRIAYASGKTVVVRSLTDLAESSLYLKHNYPTTVAKFAPSGFYIASGDESGNVKIWDSSDKTVSVGGSIPTREEFFAEPILKNEFQIINGKINDLSWDADSKRIIAVGNGKEKYGHCFTFDSGNSVGEISGHSAQINAVSIKPTRPYRAVTCSDDAGLVWYNGPPFKFEKSIRGTHSNFVKAVKFSPNGDNFISVGTDKKINVYDGKTGDFLKEVVNDHQGGIFAFDWIDNDSFVTVSSDCSIKTWKLADGSKIGEYQLDKKVDNQQLGVIVTKDHIISLSFNGDLNLFDYDLKELKVLEGHQKNITSLSVTDRLVTGSIDGGLIEWKDGVATSLSGHDNYIVDVKEIKGKLYSIGWDDTLVIEGGEKIKLPKQPKRLAGNSDSIVILYEDLVQLYDLDGKLIKELALKFTGTGVSISSNYIVIGSDTSVFYYDSKLDALESKISALRSPVSHLSISPSEKYLAVGDVTGKIFNYDLKSQELITSRWSFNNGRITSIDWLGDKFIVSGCLDTNIIVYSVEKPGKNIKLLNGHKDGINRVEWNGDSEVISVGNDGSVKKWDVDLSVYPK